jgi:hypothetical protein
MLRLDRNSEKQRSRHALHEYVRELGCHRYMQDSDITNGHVFPYKVEVNLDMLRALVLNGVDGEADGANIVIVDEVALHQWSMKLLM